MPNPVEAILDPENHILTVALRMRWNPGWALDKCSAGSVLGAIREAVAAALANDEKIGGFSYSCYDPDNEVDLGYIADYSRPICSACRKPVQWTNESWRAPEFWEHVDIPPAGEPICSNLNGDGGVDGAVVLFSNLLDVEINDKRVSQ